MADKEQLQAFASHLLSLNEASLPEPTVTIEPYGSPKEFKVVLRDPNYTPPKSDMTPFVKRSFKNNELAVLYIGIPESSTVAKSFMSVDQVQVLDSLARKGIGRTLYNAAVKEAQRRGYKGLASNPEERNYTSDKFWKKHGQGTYEGWDILTRPLK